MVARTGKGESIGDGPGAAGMGLFVPINQINHAGGVLGLEEFEGGALDEQQAESWCSWMRSVKGPVLLGRTCVLL